MIPKLAFDLANVVLFAAIIVGVCLHRRRELHANVMRACFAGDVLMVLLIELQRGAVDQSMRQFSGAEDGNPLLRFHIFVSVAAMVLWIVQLVVGGKLLKGAPLLARHRAVAWAFLAFRTTNVVTAFMLPDKG